MSQHTAWVPLQDIPVDAKELLLLKRDYLVPLIHDQTRLNRYADQIIQAQSVLLSGVDPHLTQQMSQSIERLIGVLNQSTKVLKPKKFNALQRWFGFDLEHASQQINYYKSLEHDIERTNQLSQKIQVEIQKSQARLQQLMGLREQMAKYIQAAEEFLDEYPQFVQSSDALGHFSERLSKKIYSLKTLQASNDIAMSQMQLSQQLSFSLLDRYKEAQQVLLPAWQYHIQQSQMPHSQHNLSSLEKSRQKLIKTLKQSIEHTAKQNNKGKI